MKEKLIVSKAAVMVFNVCFFCNRKEDEPTLLRRLMKFLSVLFCFLVSIRLLFQAFSDNNHYSFPFLDDFVLLK